MSFDKCIDKHTIDFVAGKDIFNRVIVVPDMENIKMLLRQDI